MFDADAPDYLEAMPRGHTQSVEYVATGNLASILEQLNISLLISTYQAGKLVSVGADSGQLNFSFHSFDQVMGVAVGKDRLAVGARRQIYFLQSAKDLAPRLEPADRYDSCWLSRTSFITGSIHGHDLAWGTEGLWVVNTLFSCLCTLSSEFNFVPRWRPPFVSRLIDQDRCHLNGLAMERGVPQFVTVLGQSDEPAGWRNSKTTGGAILDVSGGEVVSQGLCMPHSPRVHGNNLWVLNSGRGELAQVHRDTGQLETIASLPGYTRGLAFAGGLAFVGLSRIRETNIFGGLPISESHESLQCGVAVVDLATGRTIASLQFRSGVEEIFAVEVIQNSHNPKICGPSLLDEGEQEIWLVPAEKGNHAFPLRPREDGHAAQEHDSGNASNSVAELELLQRGIAAHQTGKLEEAFHLLKQGVEANPNSAEPLNLLGNLLQDMNRQAEAIACYQRAIEIDPAYASTHQNLGVIFAASNHPLDALRHFEQAEQHQPGNMNRILGATTLPIIYESTDQVEFWRTRLQDRVRSLVDSGVVIDTTNDLIPSSFNFAYQGFNDRSVMQDLAKIYRGVECCAPAAGGTWRPSGKRIRVGFLSAHFCNHTIGRLNIGMVEQISRDDFEVTVIALRNQNDEFSERFRRSADRYVVVPRSPAIARKAIADLGLDILIFADVGMDALTQTLCYSRMAPIQGVMWGHPDTTGSPAIDYFISTALAEPAQADEHYSECLVRLRTMGICYERPQKTGKARDRDYFGLNTDSHLYLCPQTLFKFHPSFDPVLRDILTADPQGELVLIEGSNPHWATALKDRWHKSMPEAISRIRFLPTMPHAEFLQLLSLGDVMLDTFPFGGGNTTYEALALGLPVVTLPSSFLRGRLGLAMLRRMEMEQELVATSPAQFVELAVRLGGDQPFNQRVREAIRQSSGVLYENEEDTLVFEEMLHAWCEEAH